MNFTRKWVGRNKEKELENKIGAKMKFTNKQLKERECLEWFSSRDKRFGELTDEEFREYLDYSERGKEISETNVYKVFKINRGRTIHELWERDFYGIPKEIPYSSDPNSEFWNYPPRQEKSFWLGWHTILSEEDGSPIPRHIAEFISKEIFRGKHDKEIMGIYTELNEKLKNETRNK